MTGYCAQYAVRSTRKTKIDIEDPHNKRIRIKRGKGDLGEEIIIRIVWNVNVNVYVGEVGYSLISFIQSKPDNHIIRAETRLKTQDSRLLLPSPALALYPRHLDIIIA